MSLPGLSVYTAYSILLNKKQGLVPGYLKMMLNLRMLCQGREGNQYLTVTRACSTLAFVPLSLPLLFWILFCLFALI